MKPHRPTLLRIHSSHPLFQLCFCLAIGLSTPLLGQTTVSGVVNDTESNTGLPGVNVLVKGSTTGTVTDIDGQYSLTVPQDFNTLTFSSVGFQTIEEEIERKEHHQRRSQC